MHALQVLNEGIRIVFVVILYKFWNSHIARLSHSRFKCHFPQTVMVGNNFIKIFNRWGKLVYESNNIYNGWDGKFNGIDQEMDAYTYLIDYITYKNERISKTGSLILLR